MPAPPMRLFTQPRPSVGRAGDRTPPIAPPRLDAVRGGLHATAVSVALVGAALAVGLTIEHFLYVPNILLVFMPVVLFAAVHYGFWAASLTSVLSVVSASFFIESPYSLPASDPGNVWALLMFLVVAGYTSSLAAKIRQRAAALDRHSRVIGDLYALSSKLAALSAADEIAVEAATQVESMLQAKTVVLLPEQGALRLSGASPGAAPLDARERMAAAWCFEHGRPAGGGTDMFQAASYLYLPLDTGRGTVGVVGLRLEQAQGDLPPDDSRLLDALRDQVAVSLDRARLAEEMRATAMLAETERLRTALLTSISHDLRTPLASILGNVSSLRQYGHLYDEPTRLEMLAIAEEETLRLNRFVDNLLNMTRIDAGALHPTIENVDLSDLIGSALKRAERQMAQHRVRLELPGDLPMVPLDFVLAEHVLVNLLDNAAKYSPAGSPITIAVTEKPDRVEIDVADAGPGIAEEDLGRIFERFFRAKVADHRRAGVGLGLAICKGFVEAMGGEIVARNRTDRSGAVFTVSLPKARPMRRRA